MKQVTKRCVDVVQEGGTKMLDDLMNSFERSLTPQSQFQPYIDPFDYQMMQDDYAEMQRQMSEDVRFMAQDVLYQRQLQQITDQWSRYLQGFDAIQGTSFRGNDLAQLEADILAAEQSGWQSGLS